MNSNIVIVVVVPFILAGTPLSIQAATLECALDPEQCSLNRQLHQENPTTHVKHLRQALPRHQGRIYTMPSQGDLLQELLTGDVMWPASTPRAEVSVTFRNKSKQQESVILDELLVEN